MTTVIRPHYYLDSPYYDHELAALKPDLVVDNLHLPAGKGIADIAKVPRVELRNYPDPSQKNLQDMLKGNAEKLGIKVQ
jgi:hypothetical protein